jgi:SRSO17 transposase
MSEHELAEWEADFEMFCARFASLFSRREGRATFAATLRGLLSLVGRKNAWQLAEKLGMKLPDAIQRLMYQTPWDADIARDHLRRFVVETIGHAEGIGILDETGFLKQGDRSAGVQRQTTGTAGKITNCQVGVFLVYAAHGSHAFLDRRLYMPKSWCEDPSRLAKAKVPSDVRLKTKPELAVEMLHQAWEADVPMQWVLGDEVYGNSSALRDAVAQSGRLYLLAVACHMTLFPIEEGEMDQTKSRVAQWTPESWHRLTVSGGEKGPRDYDWGCERVVETRDGERGPERWFVARRSVKTPTEIAYYFSNAPDDTPLQELAEIASQRYRIEQSFREAKSETGMDEYQVRHWHSWHRHITLSMMAHAWLMSIRQKANKKELPSIGV